MKRAKLVALTAVVGLIAGVGAVFASPNDGYLYGAVTTRSGNSYTGLLRWGTEEAFWDDLFQSAKEDLPYRDYAEKRQKLEDDDRGGGWDWLKVFGRRVRIGWGDGTRVFIARFGDIRSIKVTGSDSADVVMKSGAEIAVEGYANDVGATIHVSDPSLGEIDIEWKKIDTIVFAATPASVRPRATRLAGKVTTRSGSFDGFIQWDSQECLSTDRLDGDSDDGRVSIEMGTLRSIERRSSRSSRVTLADGRELVLEGTNDVNDEIRGILVEDPRFGRVKVPWDEFDRADFESEKGSGRSYDSYPSGGPLHGTVTADDGTVLAGRIVYDLDEEETWEMLNGERDGVSYDIPFERVAAIEPRGRSSSRVVLASGEELVLEDGQDVSDSNDGVLVFAEGAARPTYVPWRKVRRIELRH